MLADTARPALHWDFLAVVLALIRLINQKSILNPQGGKCTTRHAIPKKKSMFNHRINSIKKVPLPAILILWCSAVWAVTTTAVTQPRRRTTSSNHFLM